MQKMNIELETSWYLLRNTLDAADTGTTARFETTMEK